MGNELRDYEPEPVQNESTSLVDVRSEGDPEQLLIVLEKRAKLAERMRQAIETVLVSQTYPQDWTEQGKCVCLGSAGAERIARSFPISFANVTWEKEEIIDANGTGYRYVYSGDAILNDRTVHAQGNYSTRDAFLGKKDGAWKPQEDINEGNIRNAAYHVFCGNGIKELLGLRGMPVEEYRRIMKTTGRDPGKSATVERGKGTEGGTSDDDTKHQRELVEICIAIANSGQTVEADGKEYKLVLLSDSDSREGMEIAKDVCERLSAFKGKDGNMVAGRGAKSLKGKSLEITLSKARKLKEKLDAQPAEEGF
jgi:5S rRNA maturation endonuclease (ribonuclease M5)